MKSGIKIPAFACSTFVAATPQGYASLSLVNLSFLGFDQERGLPGGLLGRIPLLAAPYVPMDGVNEQGLAIAVLMLDEPPTRQDSGRTKITMTVAMRMLLDQAATVDEAVALLSRYDMQTPGEGSYHLHIADARGGAVVVEYIDQQMVVVQSDKATNFLLAPQAPASGGEGRDRYALLDARLRDSGSSLDASQAMRLLSDVCSTPNMWPDGITQTQWSAVYNLSQPSVDITIAMDYDKVFQFSLGTD